MGEVVNLVKCEAFLKDLPLAYGSLFPNENENNVLSPIFIFILDDEITPQNAFHFTFISLNLPS